MVEQDFAAGEAHIRRHHAAQRKLHEIARHQLGRGYGLPDAVAPHGRVQRQPRLQRGKGRLGAALLKQPERRIEHQQSGDDRGLDVLAEHQLEHDRRLEHPRNRRPEFVQRPAQRVRAVSGIAFGPNFSSRRRASSPDKPFDGSSLATAAGLADGNACARRAAALLWPRTFYASPTRCLKPTLAVAEHAQEISGLSDGSGMATTGIDGARLSTIRPPRRQTLVGSISLATKCESNATDPGCVSSVIDGAGPLTAAWHAAARLASTIRRQCAPRTKRSARRWP